MSKSDDWAATQAALQQQIRQEEALKPADLVLESLTVSLTDDGGMHFNDGAFLSRVVALTSQETIALGKWITSNFGA